MKATKDAIILLADADCDSREMYTEFFRFHGFHVVSVPNSRDALALAPRVDAIVTETLLPGDLDGFGLIARLKRDESTTGIPLIVVSSCAWDTDRERAQRSGCDLFLSKPCLPHDLMRAVCRLLARRRAATVALKSSTKRSLCSQARS
jgi:twitching motility two-component system response regulator PilH